MSSLASIAQSGLQAAQSRLSVGAHNVANANTPGFVAQRVRGQAVAPQAGVQTQVVRAARPGVALEEEAVGRIAASVAFEANAFVLRTARDTLGTLLDVFA